MKVIVFDNHGETFDRYTVIKDGAVYGMSDNPFHPQGFNQFAGDRSQYPEDMSHCGQITELKLLPKDVQMAIKQR